MGVVVVIGGGRGVVVVNEGGVRSVVVVASSDDVGGKVVSTMVDASVGENFGSEIVEAFINDVEESNSRPKVLVFSTDVDKGCFVAKIVVAFRETDVSDLVVTVEGSSSRFGIIVVNLRGAGVEEASSSKQQRKVCLAHSNN